MFWFVRVFRLLFHRWFRRWFWRCCDSCASPSLRSRLSSRFRRRCLSRRRHPSSTPSGPAPLRHSCRRRGRRAHCGRRWRCDCPARRFRGGTEHQASTSARSRCARHERATGLRGGGGGWRFPCPQVQVDQTFTLCFELLQRGDERLLVDVHALVKRG